MKIQNSRPISNFQVETEASSNTQKKTRDQSVESGVKETAAPKTPYADVSERKMQADTRAFELRAQLEGSTQVKEQGEIPMYFHDLLVSNVVDQRKEPINEDGSTTQQPEAGPRKTPNQ